MGFLLKINFCFKKKNDPHPLDDSPKKKKKQLAYYTYIV